MKKCVLMVETPTGQVRCGFSVKSGGDRHAAGTCPPRGKRGKHRPKKNRRREDVPTRGVVVGGLKKGGRRGQGQADKK